MATTADMQIALALQSLECAHSHQKDTRDCSHRHQLVFDVKQSMPGCNWGFGDLSSRVISSRDN